ncbi:adenosine receptor A2b-like [Oculina patagonica]
MSNVTAREDNTTRFQGEVLPPGLAVFLVALNIFLSITASLGNALILIALHKVTSIHPPTKLLFRCLAVTDLCVGLIPQPILAIYVMGTMVNVNWNNNYYMVHSISTTVLCAVSILRSTAISVDRLLALSLGLRYRHVVTLRRVRVLIICLWLLSFALGGCSWRPDIARTVFIVLMLLSLLVSVFSYIKIYLRLRHHQIQLQPHAHQGPPANGGENPLNIARYKKTISSIAWVQLALLACYLPFCVIGMLFTFGKITEGLSAMSYFLVAISILYLNSSLNPILYCWKIREVRQAVKATIGQLKCC